jgi:hypothetical protein
MALVLAGQEISALIYSQTRGDLLRIFTTTMLTGMNFYLTSIPTDYPAPTSSTAFEIPALVGMFNKGFKMAFEDKAWRRTPPGVELGENANQRTGTSLTFVQRGTYIAPGPVGRPVFFSDQGIPALPPNK